MNIKGHGYQTRGASELREGFYSLPMYRNSDDSSMGIFYIEARNMRAAFRIAVKDCREIMRR